MHMQIMFLAFNNDVIKEIINFYVKIKLKKTAIIPLGSVVIKGLFELSCDVTCLIPCKTSLNSIFQI